MTGRTIRASAATIRALWSDESLTVAQAAEQAGYVSRKAFQTRAYALGLPPRQMGRKRIITGPEFVAMWLAGVRKEDIAAFFGCDPASVAQSARSQGLPGRNKGPQRWAITLADYRARQAIAAMARTAAAEQSQVIIAEMADKIGHRIVGQSMGAK